MEGCSGGRRGLEVRFPVSIPQYPLPRCAVHTEVTPSFAAAQGAAQSSTETHTATIAVLSHLLGKGAQSSCLEQLRKGLGASSFWGWRAEHAELELSAPVLQTSLSHPLSAVLSPGVSCVWFGAAGRRLCAWPGVRTWRKECLLVSCFSPL